MNYNVFYNIDQTLRKFDLFTPAAFLGAENEDKFPAAARDSAMRNSSPFLMVVLGPWLRLIE